MSLYPLNSARLITDYRNCAANYIIKYECVAGFNSLAFSRADEENLVILLSDLLKDKQPEYITLPALNLVDVKPGFSSLISTLVVL